MKKWIIIAVLAALAIGGYIYYTSKKKKTDSVVTLTTGGVTTAPATGSGVIAPAPEPEFSWFDYTTWGW